MGVVGSWRHAAWEAEPEVQLVGEAGAGAGSVSSSPSRGAPAQADAPRVYGPRWRGDDRRAEQMPSRPGSEGTAYTLEQVAAHASVDDGWIAVNGCVYDITNFVKHHPGFVYGGQTSTILAITRNLGKECSREFAEIHSRGAWRQLADYAIGHLQPDAVSPSAADVPRRPGGATVSSSRAPLGHGAHWPCLLHSIEYLGSIGAVMALAAVSSDAARMLASNAAVAFGSVCVPLGVRSVACDGAARAPAEGEALMGQRFRQTAVLLAPRLWGPGRAVSVLVEVWLWRFQAAGGFRFGVVPESAFLWPRAPQESRAHSHTIDGLGRLWCPGGTRGVKELYGERFAEGDRLGLLLRPAGERIVGSFLRNGRDLGPAFDLPRDQAHCPVLYFAAMQSPEAVQVGLLPGGRAAAAEERALEGLVFREFAGDPTVWQQVPCSQEDYKALLVRDVAGLLADRLTGRPCTIRGPQVEVLVDGRIVEDRSSRLEDLVRYENGVHLEDLHWNLPHLVS